MLKKYGSRRTSCQRVAFVAGLLITGSMALFANAADKPDKSKKPASKSSDKPDKFSIQDVAGADRELLAKLRKPVSFEWDDVPLPEALAQLKAETKATFVINDDDLKANDLNAQLKLSGKWKDRAAEDVLRDALSPKNLDYIVEGGKIVVVSHRSALIALVTFTYDVKRLCPDAKSLRRLKLAAYRVGGQDEWDFFAGPASIKEDPAQRILTITNTWSRHAEIRNVMRKFGSDK